jgi:hypothetical protein
MRKTDSRIVGRYVDAGGTTHELVVRKTDLGGWQALDVCAAAEHVIDTPIGGDDDRPQAASSRTPTAAGSPSSAAGRRCKDPGGRAVRV